MRVYACVRQRERDTEIENYDWAVSSALLLPLPPSYKRRTCIGVIYVRDSMRSTDTSRVYFAVVFSSPRFAPTENHCSDLLPCALTSYTVIIIIIIRARLCNEVFLALRPRTQRHEDDEEDRDDDDYDGTPDRNARTFMYNIII